MSHKVSLTFWQDNSKLNQTGQGMKYDPSRMKELLWSSEELDNTDLRGPKVAPHQCYCEMAPYP